MYGLEFILAAAIASIISAGAGYAISRANQPKVPKPPPPANYSSPEGIQRWNPETNTYEWIPTPLTPEQEAAKKAREERIAALEAGLNTSEPERVAEWDKFRDAYIGQMMKPLADQYAIAKRNLEENFAARGLTGSRAHVDALAELEKDWQATQVDVQNRAVQAREQLAQQDFQNRMATLEALRSGKSLEEAQAIRNQGIAQQGVQGATAMQNARWEQSMQGAMARWANTTQGIQGGMQMGSNLALLYGLGNMAQKQTTTATRQPQPTSNLSNIMSLWSTQQKSLIPYQPAW
jgi:hypothetical protein